MSDWIENYSPDKKETPVEIKLNMKGKGWDDQLYEAMFIYV